MTLSTSMQKLTGRVKFSMGNCFVFLFYLTGFDLSPSGVLSISDVQDEDLSHKSPTEQEEVGLFQFLV